MRKLLIGLSLASAASLAANAAVVKLIGDGVVTNKVGGDSYIRLLTKDYHMVATNEYHLDGMIVVGDGVTLTIDAGTVIRGYNEYYTTANRPGTLIVARGGKCYANGTAANPIIMTDQWDNNVPGSTASSVTRTWIYRAGGSTQATLTNHAYNYGALGNLHGVWGGLVLCGKAFVNYNNGVTPNLGDALVPIEGVGTSFGIYGGGRDDDDSSGVYTYMQIRYGGYPLADASEINGVTFYGVGRGTEVHHIEVFNNQDDDFEWFGGTVNAKYLVAWGPGDDTFDSDCGFRGKNQFLFGVQRNLGGTKYESGCSDKGLEMDGAESVISASPTGTGMQEPWSASAWYNLTLVGWNGGVQSGKQRNGAIIMRDNATPQIWNSLFLNFGGFGTLIENKAGVGNNYSEFHFTNANLSAKMPATSATNALGASVDRQYFYQAQRPGMQACIRDCAFWLPVAPTCPQVADGLVITTSDQPVFGGDTSGKGPIFSLGGNIDVTSGYDNADLSDAADLPIQALTTAAYDRTTIWNTAVANLPFTPNSLAGDNPVAINPLATNAALTAVHAVPSDGWLTPVKYRGAFDATNNWAQGWTLAAKLGAFGAYVAVESQSSGGSFNGMSGVSGTFTATDGAAIGDYSLSSLLTFTAVAGKVYQLQSSASVSGPWSAVKTFRCDVAGSKSVVDILGTSPGASTFYRIVGGSVQ